MAGHPKFATVLETMGKIHEAKNSDYSDGEDPFSNLNMSERMGIPNWIGTMIRKGDKFCRLETGARKTIQGKGMSIKTESIGDTLLDDAIYSIIAFIQYCERNELGVDEELTKILKKLGI